MNAPDRTEIEERCLRIYREMLGVGALDPEDGFSEAGGDSTKAVLISTELECTFGVEVPMRIFFEKPSVREMAEWLCDALAQGAGAE
jgi:polyketide synthase PksN